MRTRFLVPVGFAILFLLVGTTAAQGQPPSAGKNSQGSADEEKEFLKEIREAYKAPFEVHEDVLKELRKSYQEPTPEREAKIFKELRRMYVLSPEREAAILREVRRAYGQPSTEQEERLFREISRAEPLPHGTVPPSIQTSQAEKMFRKLDVNGDGLLSSDEMPETLRADRARWDANRDGFLDPSEYWSSYQNRLQSLSERVAAGEIDLKLGNRGPSVNTPPMQDERRPTIGRAGKFPPGVPEWFVRLDSDGDGQVGLYEWLRGKLPIKEFLNLDPNSDGFITAEELLRHLAQLTRDRPASRP